MVLLLVGIVRISLAACPGTGTLDGPSCSSSRTGSAEAVPSMKAYAVVETVVGVVRVVPGTSALGAGQQYVIK